MQESEMNASLAASLLVKNALAELRTNHQANTDEQSALSARKAALKAQPVPMEDVKQVVCDYIDARAQLFLLDGNWGSNLRQFIYPERNMYTASPGSTGFKEKSAITFDEAEKLRNCDPNREVFLHNHPKLVIPNIGLFTATDAPLLYFFGDVIKAKVIAYFDAQKLGHDNADSLRIGTPIAERRTEIRNIDTRLAELVTERSAINAKISALTN